MLFICICVYSWIAWIIFVVYLSLSVMNLGHSANMTLMKRYFQWATNWMLDQPELVWTVLFIQVKSCLWFLISDCYCLFPTCTHSSISVKICVNSMACGRHPDLAMKWECVQSESREMESVVLPVFTVDRHKKSENIIHTSFNFAAYLLFQGNNPFSDDQAGFIKVRVDALEGRTAVSSQGSINKVGWKRPVSNQVSRNSAPVCQTCLSSEHCWSHYPFVEDSALQRHVKNQ